MSKRIIYNQEARDKLMSGIKKLYDAVSVTLGPKGRNVVIDKNYASPSIIHDGVSVAKEIELEDYFENVGAQLVKEAASKTNDTAGDGTTTSTILAYHLIKDGFKSNENPMVLREKILKEVDILVQRIKEKATPIDETDIKKVATISAQNEIIGEIVEQAIKKVGKDGLTTVEEGQGRDITIEYKEGMSFDKGYISPYFVTNMEKMEAVIDTPYILLTDQKISSANELMPILEDFLKVSKKLVIIADEIDGEALAMLVLNKMRGNFDVIAVKAPGFGDRKKAMLEDIAVITSATVISPDKGLSVSKAKVEHLGTAQKIIATQDETKIIGAQGDPSEQIKKIKAQLAITTSDFDREKLQERLARLSTGVAVISVGAQTEPELKEKKERVIDAIAATKAALDEGILPGGATTLIKLSEDLSIRNALKQPFKILMQNSGIDIDSYDFKFGEGIDVMTGQKVDMIKTGIIEPAKVVRSALQNAASIATMVLTAEVLISDNKEDTKIK